MSEMETVRAFKLGQCQVTPDDFSIQFEGQEKQSLQPKFIEVLSYLAKHHPRVIPREELIENIWGPDSYVGEKSLTNAIWHLRKNLTVADSEIEIETIRKAGYRLLVTPQWIQPEPTLIDTSKPTLPQPKRLNKALFYGLAVLLIALISSLFNKEVFINEPEIISQITNHPGSELFPAASPDGRYIAYSQESTNKPNNLYMKDTLQPQLPAQQLTFDNASEGHSVWSNDGLYLYFSRKDRSKDYCKYIQLKVTSRQEKELADCPLNGGYYYVDISSDDKTLAIYDNSKEADQSGIYFLDLTQTNNETLLQSKRFSCSKNCGYKDRDMAFSPDGKYLAVSRRYNKRFSENIFLINISNKETTQLTFGEEDIVGLSWHPDGEKIVYAALRAGNRHGYILNINDKTTQELNLPGFSYPSFAKKSKQLFYQQRIENDDIVSLELNNTIASSPFPVIQSAFNHFSPDYDEVHDRFAYISNESGFNELWSAKPDGSEREQLTQLKRDIRFPKWSRDGSKIAFLSSIGESKGDSIYIYSLKNQKLTLINSPFSQHNRPSWSWDDSKIISAIYGIEFTDIFSIDIESGKSKRLTFDGGRYGIMTSATTMLYSKTRGGLWQKNIDSQQTPTEMVDSKYFTTLYAWTFDKKGVYFHKELNDHDQIIFFDFNKKVNVPLVRLPILSLSSKRSLAFIESQNKLLYTRLSFPQTDIKMVANSPLLN